MRLLYRDLSICQEAHAQSNVMIAATAVMISEMTKVTRRTPASSPMRSMAAEAFCNLAGEMTLASPPPMPLAAAMSNPAAPIFSAVERCNAVNMAIEEVSEPLTNPPNSPRNGAMNG